MNMEESAEDIEDDLFIAVLSRLLVRVCHCADADPGVGGGIGLDGIDEVEEGIEGGDDQKRQKRIRAQ